MHLKYPEASQLFKEYLDAVANIFIFLPYFFSIPTICKTFFSPWKNISAKKTIRGFSFSDYFSRLGFSLISRGIGMAMRGSLLIFYIVVQTLYVVFIPIFTILFICCIPVLLSIQSSTKSQEERAREYRAKFISEHCLDPAHAEIVGLWFDNTIGKALENHAWWHIEQLFQTPPLARDWAVGYTPLLDEYSEDITTAEYQMGIRNHLIGRTKEIKQIERALSQSAQANALLVGIEGVGKRTILNGFAQSIYEGRSNSLLAYKRVLILNLQKIMTEYADQSSRESFLEVLFKEASETKNIILVIENFDSYITQEQGRVNLAVPIEKYANSPHLQFLAVSTPFAYESFIFPNEKVRPLFTKIDVNEISQEAATTIVLERSIAFERRYKIIIPYETILDAVDKSNFYITTIPFPEKALQLLDASCVYLSQQLKQTILKPEHIQSVLSQRIHVPTSLSENLKQQLLHMEELLKARVIGQDEAVSEIASSLRRSFLLLGKRKKPLSSFLFLGPTGVGKTETAKVISSVFFGSDTKMIRFDMSLYQSKDDISKLVGSIQTLNPGLLTSAIRENPYGVLLIDEIEKADHDLLNIFLTILDEGYFTDGYGQLVDCKNLIIVATSNAGAEFIFAQLQNTKPSESIQKINSASITDYLVDKHLFSPEFLNRFDGVVAYNPITPVTALQIAKQIINRISQDVFTLYGVTIQISPERLAALTTEGFTIQYGVRNLERVLRKKIEDKIAQDIMGGSAKSGSIISF